MALVQAILKGYVVPANSGYRADQEIEHVVEEEVVFQQDWELHEQIDGDGTGDGMEQYVPTGEADEAEDYEFIHGVIDEEDADGTDEWVDSDEDRSDEDEGQTNHTLSEWNQGNIAGMTVDDATIHSGIINRTKCKLAQCTVRRRM